MNPAQLPPYPGLRHKYFHNAKDYPGITDVLARSVGIIREELSRLESDSFLLYTRHSVRSGKWSVFPFYYMGTEIKDIAGRCPATLNIIRSLPRVCHNYAWGDFLFSALSPGTHLAAHCSVDNLRLRCHLGITVPEGCEIRVGAETRKWAEGEVLLFEDDFEHEVWNRSNHRRVVLIVDFWHPDLSDIEIEAITAGFKKLEIRKYLSGIRAVTPELKQRAQALVSQFEVEDKDPILKKYWKVRHRLESRAHSSRVERAKSR